MALTLLVRSTNLAETRITFDGMQPVVVGRGASCDVRLPDASVSFRHASFRAQGTDFLVVDEGSSNGTFVGGIRVAPRTSRVVRSGDRVRVGRVWIELRMEQGPVTRDVAGATRDVALAMVSAALARLGEDATMRVEVVEGRDQGATLRLAEEGRAYRIGRAAECDLPLADADASREHATVTRRGTAVTVRDAGTKNGSWLGEARVPAEADTPWRLTQLLQLGRTVLALREPVGDALAHIEAMPDQEVPEEEIVAEAPTAAPEPALPPPIEHEPASAAPVTALPGQALAPAKKRSGWSGTDFLVMAAAVGVLALSIAGLLWLLKP